MGSAISNPFGKGSNDPPPPPDYAGAATAQGQANTEAARQAALLNNPNVNAPTGTQTWVMGADGRPTVTQTLSPEQQSLYNQQTQAKGLMGDLSIQGGQSLKGVVGTPVDFSGAPAGGGSYEGTRKQVIDAMMSRANEDYAKQSDESNSSLIAAGIRPGTKAYADRQQMIERSRNDARTQAEISGGNAASQAFGMDEARRKSVIAELLTKRQTPLNEMSALMSGSQVSNPFAMPGASQSASVAPPPVFGATTATGDYNADIYNAQQQQRAGNMSGLFGLGAATLGNWQNIFGG